MKKEMEKMMKKKIRWGEVAIWIIIYSLFVTMGFILGMVYQQLLFTQEIVKILSFLDLELNINLNATKFAEELNRTFIPAWKEAFNNTINNFWCVNNSYCNASYILWNNSIPMEKEK